MVIWSRGSKQAKTKKRLLSEQVPTAVFDEKFQINTQMELDEEGKPTKSKIVSQSNNRNHLRLISYDFFLLVYADSGQ